MGLFELYISFSMGNLSKLDFKSGFSFPSLYMTPITA